MKFDEVLRTFGELFEREGVRYVLIGGLAMYLYGDTARKIFAAASPKPVVGDAAAPVASAEHLAMMKAVAMKNDPHRALFEGEDVRILMKAPGVDRRAIRDYFESQGLLGLYDAIERAG